MKKEKYLDCFPYAGGNVSVFDQLKKQLEPEIQVIGIEYPGHGKRFKENAAQSWDELMEDIAIQLRQLPDAENVALMGYSMGSIVAAEVVQRKLLSRGASHVFAMSHNAPHLTDVEDIWIEGTDYEIISRMKSLGGFERVDEKIIASRYFQTMFMNPLKADYHLLQIYRREAIVQNDMEATVLYSPKDASVNHIKEWEQYFINVNFKQIGENHFILKEHASDVADIVRMKCKGDWNEKK